jgi:hypothetical protein
VCRAEPAVHAQGSSAVDAFVSRNTASFPVCIWTSIADNPVVLYSYEWNGKRTTTHEKSHKFSRLSDRPGQFKIMSIAHEKNHCQVQVDDIERVVHALPSASISAGKEFIETVEEGQSSFASYLNALINVLTYLPALRVLNDRRASRDHLHFQRRGTVLVLVHAVGWRGSLRKGARDTCQYSWRRFTPPFSLRR